MSEAEPPVEVEGESEYTIKVRCFVCEADFILYFPPGQVIDLGEDLRVCTACLEKLGMGGMK